MYIYIYIYMYIQTRLFADCCPCLSVAFTLDSPVFRALLLRRLRLLLPFDAAACRCRRPVDPLGDHVFALLTLICIGSWTLKKPGRKQNQPIFF